ncbi:DUF2125 domain-containing protein [Shimia abyssi]|uniref:DUF2125 domain-containing protein n=1 Tax=Shimia abyssi TaxID=1662395 RepID=A0A2P8F7K1_9RHOB|nr:DUF2125 domain-containing protein [Shimia abyssi]PSL17690.1 hypothetical protein CLV88_11537 [Shimia abyssi]
MKRLAFLIIFAAFVWSGFWAVGFWGLNVGLDAWFKQRRAEGWVAEFDERSILGYPSRFDITFENLSLADPDTSVAWEAPFFQILALSYRPNHVIAVWPNNQTLATPTEKLTLRTKDMRASLVLLSDTNLSLDRTNLSIQNLALNSTAGWQLTAQNLDLALHSVPDTAATYRVGLNTKELAPNVAFRMPADVNLPRTFSALNARLTAKFDRPLDRTTIEESRPQPTALDLELAEITWGELHLNAAGQVTLDKLGYPTGAITIRAVNWREILNIARASGQFSSDVLNTVESALDLISKLSGNSNELDLPLTFENNTTRLGPVPIAPAPRIRLR